MFMYGVLEDQTGHSQVVSSDVGELLRAARAELSQGVLAARASTTQPAVSLYESGRQVPELETLERLVGAAGYEVEIRLRPARSKRARVLAMRKAIAKLAADHGLSNPRLFGSVARGDDCPDSDVDIVVDISPDTSLFDTLAFAQAVEDLFQDGTHVDIGTSKMLPSDTGVVIPL